MKFASLVLSLLLLCSAGFASEVTTHPKVNSDELLLPSNYRDWVKLSPKTAGLPTHKHKHVASQLFVEPRSFEVESLELEQTTQSFHCLKTVD